MTRDRAAAVALVGIAAVWGLTFTMVQNAIERLPALTFLAYRFGAAAAIVALVFARPLRRLSAGGWRAGLLMGAFLTAGYVFQTLGLEHTSASNAGFITGLFVVFTPLLAAIVLRQRIGRLAWTAAVLSAFGLYLLSGTHGFSARGDGLEVLCALGFFVQTFAQRYASPERTALILASEPAFAGLFGWSLAGDHLSAIAWLGAVLIMGAILTVEAAPRFRPPRPLPEG